MTSAQSRAWEPPSTWRETLGLHLASAGSVASTGASAQPESSAGPRLTGLFTALGGSTGEVFEAEFVNDGPGPVDVGANGLVLEPISSKAQQAARNEFARAAAGRPTTKAKVKAYCLEFVREPPAEGMVFRVAPSEVQNQFQSMRNVMRAAKRVLDAGGLTPDSDPTQYFDAIVQWSLWTKENGFDVKSFGEAFTDRTKKNFDAAKQPWTDQVEQIVRGLIPNRWSDIERVLGEADILEQAIRN